MNLQLQAQHCMVCGESLAYGEEAVSASCHFCGKEGETLIRCPAGHYVCDSCHGAGALELLPKLASRVSGDSPEAILEELFTLPSLPMHGPEHHSMTALALLLAAGKQGAELPEGLVAEAIRRGSLVPGGSCGYLGACGAGVALGVAVGLLLGATPLKGTERGLANRATAAALDRVGDGQPRCCKRALRLAVRAGRDFFFRELAISFPPYSGTVRCGDMKRNGECPGKSCDFFPKNI